jgi:hypothetical protein
MNITPHVGDVRGGQAVSEDADSNQGWLMPELSHNTNESSRSGTHI